MFKRIGDKYYIEKVASPILEIVPSIDLDTFNVQTFHFNVLFHKIQAEDCYKYKLVFDDALNYIESLLKNHPKKSSTYFFKMWDEESNLRESFDWMQKHVW